MSKKGSRKVQKVVPVALRQHKKLNCITFNITVKGQVQSFNDIKSFDQFFHTNGRVTSTFKKVFGAMFLKTKS